MGATTSLALPYPTLASAANGPAAFQALADRIETVFTGSYGVPGMIRVSNPADATNFGAGVHTLMSGWTTDYTKGPSGLFTVGTGRVTCNTAGIYLLVFNFTGSVGSAAGTISLRPVNGTDIYCRTAWPAGNIIASVSSTRYLAAGSVVGAYVYNGSGTMTINQDTASAPCAYTVTRLAAST